MFNLNKKWFIGTAIVIGTFIMSFSLIGKNTVKQINSVIQINDTTYWCNNNVPERYRPSDEQIERINKIKSEYDDLIQPEIRKLSSVSSDFSNYLKQNNVSNKKAKEYQNEIRNIENNIEALKVEANNKIKTVLNNNQITYYNDFVFNSWWGWDCSGHMHTGNTKKNSSTRCNDGCCRW